MGLVYLFFLGSIPGWCAETVFRRFYENAEQKWVNPGFLVGPCLPLYGFGVCILYLLCELRALFPPLHPVLAEVLQIVLMTLCMTLLELVAGLIFVRGMKLQLWDYSNKPFNYKGIICLEFTVYWAVLSAVYSLLVHPWIVRLVRALVAQPAFLFPLGIICGVFFVDLGVSLQIAAKIKRFAQENNILVRYEELKASIKRYAMERREKYMFLFAFWSKTSLNEHLKKYMEALPNLPAFRRLVDRAKEREK